MTEVKEGFRAGRDTSRKVIRAVGRAGRSDGRGDWRSHWSRWSLGSGGNRDVCRDLGGWGTVGEVKRRWSIEGAHKLQTTADHGKVETALVPPSAADAHRE